MGYEWGVGITIAHQGEIKKSVKLVRRKGREGEKPPKMVE
jgi:hypothetical protein